MANLQAKDGNGALVFIKATGTGTNADPFSTDVNIGTQADTSATSDTGTFSLIALVKRLLGKLPTLVTGRMPVDGSGVTQPVSATALPLPTGAATEVTLGNVSAKLPATLGSKTAALSLPVTLSSDGLFATAFGAAADAAATTDTASTGFVSLVKRLLSVKLPTALSPTGRFLTESAVRTAATNPLQISLFGTASGGNIKAAAGSVYGLSCINTNAGTRYLQLFNQTTAPTTGNVPIEVHAVYGNSGELILGQDYFSLNGLDFTTGISWGLSTTAATYTAATAVETFFSVRYI